MVAENDDDEDLKQLLAESSKLHKKLRSSSWGQGHKVSYKWFGSGMVRASDLRSTRCEFSCAVPS